MFFEVFSGRFIVSDCSSEIYRTVEYIDYYLNFFFVKYLLYVKDIYYFIDIVKKLKMFLNFLFFIMDIESLYINIDI